jgi:GTP-binding protein
VELLKKQEKMVIKTAEFIMANTNYLKCPNNERFEFAFIGRSNVGKSSIINMLTGHKKLAKTSSNPGKTQKIIHFIINNTWYLVDLPGYGYAKISKTMREEFSTMTKNYLLKRNNLACVFVLIDACIAPQKIDLEFMQWLGERGIAFVIIFTKCDKIGANTLTRNIENYKKTLLETWETLPQIFLSSATKTIGKEDILNFIDNVMAQ